MNYLEPGVAELSAVLRFHSFAISILNLISLKD